MVENRNAIQNSPPARRRDSSAVGSKAKLKMTTTSNAKNNMELKTSRERHSKHRSLARLAAVSRAKDVPAEGVLLEAALISAASRLRASLFARAARAHERRAGRRRE